MPWGSNLFPLLIITSSGGFTGLFVYSPNPGTGNLIGSWTSAAGTDPYGNPFPAGINVTSGQLAGVAITALRETVQPGPLLVYGTAGQNVVTFTTAGSNNWVAPAGLIGSVIDTVICIGGGGGGDGLDAGGAESGGGGGACSTLANVAVTIGNTYHPIVGAGGAADTVGLQSSFAGDAVTVIANPGAGASDPSAGAGGAASTTPAGVVSFAGGRGGPGHEGTPFGGGGGGGAASDTRGGNAGLSGTSSAGGNGGAAAPGLFITGAAGGTGGAPGASAPATVTPGAGGGGGGNGAAAAGAAGSNGIVILAFRTSSTVNLLASLAVASGTDPNTGTNYLAGVTSYGATFGDSTSIVGANVNVGASATWNINNTSVRVASAGSGLRVAEGSNAKQGTATLAAGTVVVSNTSVTANSRIFLTAQTSGAAPGALRVSARTAGTSFTITSSNAGDTSLVAWEIFEPA